MMLWTAKLRGYDEDSILGEKARRLNLTVHYYPINYYEEDNVFYFVAAGVVKGLPANVRKCFAELRKTKQSAHRRYLAHLEVSKEAFLSVTAHKASVEFRKMVRAFYKPTLIHLKPAVIHPDGHEEWEVCSFSKADLDSIIRIAEQLYHLELSSVRRAKFGNLHIVMATPKLSSKQRAAMEVAITRGYYAYPRRAGLKDLARASGLGVTTLHAHLRKAENKLIPYLFSVC
jgi:predicted DNA binding protein